MSEVPLYEQPSSGQCLKNVKTILEIRTMFMRVIDSGLVVATERGVPREQKMLKGHLPRVIHHQVY